MCPSSSLHLTLAVIGGAVAGGVALVVIVVAVGMVVAMIKRHSTSLKR